MTAVVVALGVVVALLGVLVVGLLRSHAEVLRALHDLGVGQDQLRGTAAAARHRRRAVGSLRAVAGAPEPAAGPAPGRLVDIEGVDPHGRAVRIGLDGARGATLLAFLPAGCGTCLELWRALGTDAVDRVPGDGTRVVVVTRGPEKESPAAVADLAPDRVITVMSSAAWDDYGVPVSPYFLLVDGAHGVVGEGAAATWSQAVDLLAQAVADAGIEPGSPEPAAAGIEPGSPEPHRPVDDAAPAPAPPADPA